MVIQGKAINDCRKKLRGPAVIKSPAKLKEALQVVPDIESAGNILEQMHWLDLMKIISEEDKGILRLEELLTIIKGYLGDNGVDTDQVMEGSGL